MSAGSPQSTGRRSKWDCPESVPVSMAVSIESQMNNFPVTMSQVAVHGVSLSGPPSVSQSQSSSEALDAAAAAAARINAMLMAKGKLKLPQTPNNKPKSSKSTSHAKNKDDMVVAEIEINDVPIVCRNLLTRGHTQDEINKISGAAVSTRGRYMNADEKQIAAQGDRPLYLCIQAQTQKSVDRAVNRIKEIIGEALAKEAIKQPLPPVVTSTARSSPMAAHNSPYNSLPQLQPGMHFVQDKIFVGLEHAPLNFNAKEKVEGPGGSFLHHIQNETGAKVHLRGKGSGFIEPMSGREAFEPMYIYITHPKPEGLASAKTLCENLLQTVHAEYSRYQSQITSGLGPPSVYSMVTPSPAMAPAQNPVSVLAPVMTSQPYSIQPQTSVPYTFANTNAQYTAQQFRQPLPTPYTAGLPAEISQNQVVSGIMNPGTQNNFQVPQPIPGPCYTPQPLQQAGTSMQQVQPVNSAPMPVSLSSSEYQFQTTGTSNPMPLPPQPQKRRFTEERAANSPEGLLGYRHGPFHLTNLGTRSSQDMGSGMKIAADSALFGRERERQLMPLLSNHGDHSEMPKTSMQMLHTLNMQGHISSPSHKRHKTSDSLGALAQYGEDSSDEEDDRHKRGGRYRPSGNASRNMYHPYFQHSIHQQHPHQHHQQQQHGLPRSQNSMPFWMAPN
ncbi:KH homology domain-containing protein 4-like isoform X2 [Hemiscyllium ocellatum]|uniref:KH homology domain-containing protein 4-like isoform X2 n=1 Tax=Hemiscyllium ocellatum TaxID=170820 RepID=UPI002966174D|nr:KH homology domain-containing protein 4-like isoform X2 [Hemiscyllium ocellatum]